ncbi:MAG: hypothetical protein QXG00_04515 [Candidatus Woesearchaeota archaeon]
MVIKKIVILFLLITFNSLAQLKVEVKTDSTDYLIGDFINLQIKSEYSKGFILQEPLYRENLKKFEIIKENQFKSDTLQNKITYSKEITLAYYDSAEVYIPSFSFILTTQGDTSKVYFSSDSIAVRIHSLEVKAEEDIKDIKAPIKIPLNILEIILWILLGLLVLAILYFIIRKILKRKNVEPEKPEIIIPPHIVALTKLEELEKEKLWQNGKVKEYHSRITEIIREYFERRFSFPALELTSSEQIQLLTRIKEAEKIIKTTEEFFTNADLVKFAKFNPVPDLNEIMMSQAKEIVNSTVPSNLTDNENNINPEVNNV